MPVKSGGTNRYAEMKEKAVRGETFSDEDWLYLEGRARLKIAKDYPAIQRDGHMAVEDACQDILLEVSQRLQTFSNPDCAFSTWFFNWVRTVCLNLIRSKNAKKRAGKTKDVKTVSIFTKDGEQWYDAPAEDNELERIENQEEINQILDRIKDKRHREVFLALLGSKKQYEIAQALGVSRQRANQLKAALQQYREKIK